MVTRLTFILSLFLTILSIASVSACSCWLGPPPLKESFKTAVVVFSGEVLAVEPDAPHILKFSLPFYRYYRVTFRVSRSWKGSPQSTTAVFTGFGNGDCGYRFKVGKKYLVFAQGAAQHPVTGICDRTKVLSYAKDDIAKLGMGITPAANDSPFVAYTAKILMAISLIGGAILLAFYWNKKLSRKPSTNSHENTD